MIDSTPICTPMLSSPPLTIGSPEFSDPTLFRQIIDSLQYLQLTRPDLALSVNRLAQKMNRLTERDWTALKRVLRYLKGSIDLDLFLLKATVLPLTAYCDADWARDRLDYCSTSAYLVFLGPCLVSWKSFKQRTVARSSTEAKYRALAFSSAVIAWVRSLMSELGLPCSASPVLSCDNISATYVACNPMFHSHMKHLAIDYHFVRQ